MRAIISRLIVGMFKVLVPLFYILFILAGIACGLVTSVIAYQTVKGLFPKDATVWIFSIPLLIVISFEVTKVFIIFLNKQYSDSRNEKYLINKSLFLFLRGLLIAISGIFTLIFTFYNLDNPELEKKLDSKKVMINQSYDNQRNDINANYDRQIVNINNAYDNQIQPWKDEMKTQEQYKYSNGEFRGPQWAAANQNVQQLNEKRNDALTKNQQARTKDLVQIEEKRIQAIDSIGKTLKTDNSSSNKMINALLEVITFNPNYNKGYYIFAICIFSVLISIGLEFVIWSSFTVLAINHGDVFEIDLEMKNLNEKHGAATEAIDGMNTRNMKSRLANMLNLKNISLKKAKQMADESLDEIDKI